MLLRFVAALLLILASFFNGYEAAPTETQPKVEQLVRVYPINEEQYEKLLKLTDGKHVISEARLTSAGFTAVRNSLDSGWHSLLRIMGLTTTSRSEVAKIDIDGQPLCVMKRSFAEDITNEPQNEPRALAAARDVTDDDSVINCIVVLKKDTPVDPNPNFAPYWYHENNQPMIQPEAVAAPQPQLPLEPQAEALVAEQVTGPEQPMPVAEEEDPEPQVVQPTAAPKLSRNKSKSRNRNQTKSKPKSTHKTRSSTKTKTTSEAAASRQYGSPYGQAAPSPYGGGYGSPYGSAYPYGGYNQNPYEAYNPYGSYGQQPGGFGQFPGYGQQPAFYPPQFFGQPSPFNPYPFYEETEEAEQPEVEEEDEEDDEGYEVDVDVDGSYEEEYYD